MVFGSGISDRDESLDALLNLCLLKGLPGRGAIIPTALQANARGAAAILAPLASPEEVLRSADTAGIFLYEEDPFQYLNGETVKEALAKKEFILACDLFPTEATAVAGLTIPATSFAEKEGTIVSGDGTPRAVRKAVAGGPGGPEFLRRAPEPSGGKSYNGDELMADLIKAAPREGGRRQGTGRRDRPARGDFSRRLSAPATAATRPYRLILRDLFVSPYLTGRELDGTGRRPGAEGYALHLARGRSGARHTRRGGAPPGKRDRRGRATRDRQGGDQAGRARVFPLPGTRAICSRFPRGRPR